MCGIFGVINFNGKPINREKVIEARDVLKHRGPDDEGLYVNAPSNVALAHRRLSIIDLSPSGHQPMSTEDGRYTIVFNGEIYNYKTIKNSKFKIQKFLSDSDTEVLLKSYETEGEECLKWLRGMFAFAVWDEKEKSLFAARDRFGIKPFYYIYNNNEFVFASELKAIKQYKKNLTLSMQGIDAFLKTGSIPAPLTIYNEVRALVPGHYLTIKNSKLKIQNYWNFTDLLNDNAIMQSCNHAFKYDNDARKRIRSALLDTMSAHLVSDVEVGAFLSGGIDSTAIVSLMRQVGHERVKTISVTFPGNELDESKYSQIAAEKYKTEHFEYQFKEQELIDGFDKILEVMDQPTIDGINTYFVSKAAKEFGLKVVMSGVGGDELFGGYPTFRNIPRINNYLKLKRAVPFADGILDLTAEISKRKIPAKGTEFLLKSGELNAAYKLYRGLFTNAELEELGWNFQFEHPFSSVIANEVKQSLTPLQYVSFLESVFYMRNQLLRDSDVFSMMHSIELRVPFVDHLLYENVLPYLQNGYVKNYQKKMLVEGVEDLPHEIVFRPKMGFTFPFADWISRGKLKESILTTLRKSNLNELFDKSEVMNIVGKFNTGNIHWSRLWSLFIMNNYPW